MSKLLLIEPLEPLSLSRRQITGPLYYQSTPLSFSLPQPTTVLGALGSALDIRLGEECVERLEDIKTVRDKIAERLKCSIPVIMGPLLLEKDGLRAYVPIKPNLYVSLEYLNEAILVTKTGYYASSNLCQKYENACVEATTMVNIGISLARDSWGKDKVIRQGYMYKYPIVIYRDARTKRVLETYTAYLLNCENSIEETIIRVGGEGRVAKLRTIKSKNELTEKLASPLSNLSEGVYLAISHIPIIPGDDAILEIPHYNHSQNSRSGIRGDARLYGLEFISSVSNIIGILQPHPAQTKIVVERLGLGYSEVARKRRPEILALPPGTLLRITKTQSKTTIKTVEPIEILWSIGYSTLLKITTMPIQSRQYLLSSS